MSCRRDGSVSLGCCCSPRNCIVLGEFQGGRYDLHPPIHSHPPHLWLDRVTFIFILQNWFDLFFNPPRLAIRFAFSISISICIYICYIVSQSCGPQPSTRPLIGTPFAPFCPLCFFTPMTFKYIYARALYIYIYISFNQPTLFSTLLLRLIQTSFPNFPSRQKEITFFCFSFFFLTDKLKKIK